MRRIYVIARELAGHGLAISGRVYDNSGMEPIRNTSKVVFLSDAGTPFDFRVPKWFGSRIMRYVDIGRNQVGALRRRAITRRLHRGYLTVRVGDSLSAKHISARTAARSSNRD